MSLTLFAITRKQREAYKGLQKILTQIILTRVIPVYLRLRLIHIKFLRRRVRERENPPPRRELCNVNSVWLTIPFITRDRPGAQALRRRAFATSAPLSYRWYERHQIRGATNGGRICVRVCVRGRANVHEAHTGYANNADNTTERTRAIAATECQSARI